MGADSLSDHRHRHVGDKRPLDEQEWCRTLASAPGTRSPERTAARIACYRKHYGRNASSYEPSC